MAESHDDARAAWQAAYDRARLRDVPFETMSGIPLEPVHGDGPYPGQYPYTRGLHAAGYRSRLWTMRMFAGFGTAEDTNARFKELGYTYITLDLEGYRSGKMNDTLKSRPDLVPLNAIKVVAKA